MLEIEARVREVRSSEDGEYKYVEFVNLDIGDWSQRFRASEWNGFKEKDDVLLTCVPSKNDGTRATRNGGTMATSDLVLRVVEINPAMKL